MDASYLKFFNKNWNLQFHSQFPFGADVKAAQVNADLNYESTLAYFFIVNNDFNQNLFIILDDDSITTFKYTTGAVGFGHVQSVGDKFIIGFESVFGTL